MNHQHEDKLCFKVYVLVLVTYQHGMGPLSIHSFSFEKIYCEIRMITSKICNRHNEAFRKSYKYLVKNNGINRGSELCFCITQ